MEDRLYLDRRIHELLGKGKKPATIAHELNCQIRRVYYQRLKFNKGLDWHDQPRTGAPRKVSPTTARLVTRVLRRKDVQTPKRASVKLKTSYHLDISASTVKRTLKCGKFRYRIKPLKPLVNKADEVARVKFARARRGKGFWERVWWSDEKAFEIRNEPRGMWVKVGDKVPVRKKGVVPPTIRIWGAISHEGKSELYKIPSYWTAKEYKTHLEKKALPDINPSYL
jgi:transposase